MAYRSKSRKLSRRRRSTRKRSQRGGNPPGYGKLTNNTYPTTATTGTASGAPTESLTNFVTSNKPVNRLPKTNYTKELAGVLSPPKRTWLGFFSGK